jgi:glycosyltransferase involved in cell wall biosynthesis
MQPKSNAHIKLSVLMPVRNEGMSLKIIVRILMAIIDVPSEILIVYDFPEDNSVPVIAAMRSVYPNVRGVHNTLGRGVINAIRTGVQAASGEYVLIFVADEITPVLAIEDMLALMDEGCDFVSCTRYAYGGRRLGSHQIRGFLSHLANRLFHIFARSCFTDPTAGNKLFRRAVFERLHLETKTTGWEVAFEMAIKAQLAGLRLGEVPTISADRLYGGESTYRTSWIKQYLRCFIWGALQLRRSFSDQQSRTVFVRIPAKARKQTYVVSR